MIATTGFFDGVHKGHQAVLQRVASLASEQGHESAVITFWPHPRVVLHFDAERVTLLNSLDEKKMRLHQLGIKHVFVLPFTPELSKLSPEQFFETYLHRQFNVRTLVVGYNHHLGYNADAGYEQMYEIGAELGIGVEKIEAVAGAAGAISSTKIREALRNGVIETANDSLGYSYRLDGVVVEGQRLGRTIGFPTANMQLYEPLKQVPGNGVYAVRVLKGGNVYQGMCNIGMRPTVQQAPIRTIETHIFDFDEDIYGQDLTIELITRIRDERRFGSLDELKVQLRLDDKAIRKLKFCDK